MGHEFCFYFVWVVGLECPKDKYCGAAGFMGCGLALHRAIDTLCLCHRWDFVDVGGQWNGAIGRWDKGHQAQARASDGDGLQQHFSHCFGRPHSAALCAGMPVP